MSEFDYRWEIVQIGAFQINAYKCEAVKSGWFSISQ